MKGFVLIGLLSVCIKNIAEDYIFPLLHVCLCLAVYVCSVILL